MKAQGRGCGGGKLLGGSFHVVTLCVVTAKERAPVLRLHYRAKRYCGQLFAHISDRKVL